jgi:spore coat polysaccharide biosynthesis protein SpsF (cytidylyltransferase family)
MSIETLAIIQANATDLLPGDTDPSHYAIAPLRRSRTIERIVIAAPDTDENTAFEPLARTWGVDLFLGSTFDVVDRLLRAAEHVGAAPSATIARLLLNRFYLDIDLVDRSIDLRRETASDFVMLPYDFDINFGADVLTLDALRRVDRALTGPEHAHERFRPWFYIEDHPDEFRVTTCEMVPSYPRSRLDEIRGSGLFAERDCGTCSTFTYDLIAGELTPADVVLDIACGSGEGTAALAPRCRTIVGCDLDADVVAQACRRGVANAEFHVQDGCALTYPDAFFSTIVSSNTLEHVDDDEAMLRSFHRVLQPDGRLILETPILRKRPFNSPLLSSHVREYDKDALVGLLTRCGFHVTRKRGMNRGIYLDWDRAREAVLVHATKTS